MSFCQSYAEFPSFEDSQPDGFEAEINFLRNFDRNPESLCEQYRIQIQILQERVANFEKEKKEWQIERAILKSENEKLQHEVEFADLPDLEEVPILPSF